MLQDPAKCQRQISPDALSNKFGISLITGTSLKMLEKRSAEEFHLRHEREVENMWLTLARMKYRKYMPERLTDSDKRQCRCADRLW